MNEKIKRKDTSAWLEALGTMKTEETYKTGSLVNPKKPSAFCPVSSTTRP